MKNWFGVVAPAQTPKEIIHRLGAEIVKIQRMPDFKEALAAQGVEPFVNGPDEFAAFIKTEQVKYARIIKAANIKLEH